MLSENAVAQTSRNWARLIIVFVVAFDLAAFWQWMGGAYQSEFGGHPDEGAHYVSGLAMQDFISGRIGTRDAIAGTAKSMPVENDEATGVNAGRPAFFASRLAAFSIALSGWTFAFGASRLAVLLLVAAFAAGVATLLYDSVREEFGDWAAMAAALLWLCAASIRESYGLLMPEMLGGLAMLGAALAWGSFLDRGRRRDALAFGILAAISIWTEGAGVAALVMAGVSLLWMRLWIRLARWDVWLAGALPVLSMLCVRKHYAAQFDFTAGAVAHAATFYTEKLAFVAGIAVAVFAVIGVAFRCFSRGERRRRWMAIASLPVSVLAYHCVASGHLEERHAVAAAPCLILLAMAGVKSISVLTSARVADAAERRRRESLWMLLLVLLVLPFEVMKVRAKEFDGFGPIARTLIDEAPRDARILISSDATGEGMFLSELAMNGWRHGFAIELASTSLVADGENGGDLADLRDRFAEDRELLAYLTAGRIQYIVLDDPVTMKQRAGYHDQIRRVIENNVRSFWPLHAHPITRDGEVQLRPIQIFRVIAGG